MADTNWKDIVGLGQLTDNLKSALKYNKISHAYMIQGEKLSGKMMVADIFARALQCEAADGVKPCNQCRSCRQALNRNHPDIIYVEHDKPNVISVDNIRQQINGDIAIKPYSGPKKIYIVDEAEKMNVQAQNALLKTLEEPPEYAVIMLLTTRVEAMLQTILSRCVVLETKPVADDVIKNYLMRKVEIPDYRASICASFARGNVGRAIALSSNEDFDHMKSSVIDTMKNICDMEINQIAAHVKKISEEKFDTNDYLDLCFIWFRDVLLYKAVGTFGDKSHIIFKEEMTDIANAARHFDYEGIERIIHSIDRARSRISANVNFDLTFELMLLDIKSA
jgi:DNA polymerase-3 subunit delta'